MRAAQTVELLSFAGGSSLNQYSLTGKLAYNQGPARINGSSYLDPISPAIWKTAMRRVLPLSVVAFSLLFVPVAFSQNNLRPGSQPNGQAAGSEEAPVGGQAGAPGVAPNDAMYKAQVSYALGRNFAANLKENHVDCDLNSLVAGIRDALTGAQPKLTEEQCDAVLQRFSREMQQKEMSRMQQEAMKNQQEATQFLRAECQTRRRADDPHGLAVPCRSTRQGAVANAQ